MFYKPVLTLEQSALEKQAGARYVQSSALDLATALSKEQNRQRQQQVSRAGSVYTQ